MQVAGVIAVAMLVMLVGVGVLSWALPNGLPLNVLIFVWGMLCGAVAQEVIKDLD